MQNIYHYSFDDGEKGIRFSGSHPKLLVWLKDGIVRITDRSGFKEFKAGKYFGLDTLEDIWRAFANEQRHLLDTPINTPFAGGGIGFFSYDFGKKFEGIKTTSDDDYGLPDWCFAFYDGAKSEDWSPPPVPIKSKKRDCFVGASPLLAMTNRLAVMEEIPASAGMTERFAGTTERFAGMTERFEMTSNLTKAEYIKNVERIKEYLRNGDVYQVNFAQRFSIRTAEDPFKLYCSLQKNSPVPYAAYLDLGSFQILSHSPELFLKVGIPDATSSLGMTWRKNFDSYEIVTEPIKGTRRRGTDLVEDERLYKELLNSEKDKAELTMIVDLERNDLSRICKPGSVKVEDLYKIKSFPSVHHQTARVKGDLNNGVKLFDILKATFPGGSVTGAPKIRAMEIIEELEPNCRGVYTGSIGYLDVRGSFQFNIAIRTIVMSGGSAWFHLGGGIVADSEPDDEYLETIYKGGPFWQLFLRAEVADGKHPFQTVS